ncbi:ABC transporter substrate-binding protein [Nocardioides houyundeii]|uniref:ABC transporter substrate-binding protein n=1 Tax=Nocardioides houyundeii TaxID=2045452 RepID=UPI000DF17A59|nr:ABC transporter substrate-binding protein [Nocardioides houyundeii]
MTSTSTRPGRVRRSLALLGALALATTLAACGGDGDAATSDSGKPVLRVGVQKDGIRAILKQAELLEDLPYEIEWSEFTAGPPIVEAASADQIDVAWVGSTPPIFGAAADADFKIVAAVVERDSHSDSVLVPEGSDIKSVEDLKGKKVAVGRGTSSHGMLIKALNRAGLGLDDIEVNYLAPADGLAAFTSGAVDAWVVWDPFVTQAIQEADAVEIAGGAPDDNGLQFEIASSKSLEETDTREMIVDFVDRVRQGFAWAVDNHEAWGKSWAEESGLPESTTTVVTENKKSDVGPVTDEIIDASQHLADLFTEAGELPTKIDFASIVEPGIVK